MRGVISFIAKRHSKANNKYMQSYDVNELTKLKRKLTKLKINQNMLLNYCRSTANEYGIKLMVLIY